LLEELGWPSNLDAVYKNRYTADEERLIDDLVRYSGIDKNQSVEDILELWDSDPHVKARKESIEHNLFSILEGWYPKELWEDSAVFPEYKAKALLVGWDGLRPSNTDTELKEMKENEQVWLIRAQNGNAVRLRCKEDLAFSYGKKAKRDEDGTKEIFVDYLKDQHDIMRSLVDRKIQHVLLESERVKQMNLNGEQVQIQKPIEDKFERIKNCEGDNEDGEEGEEFDENGEPIEPIEPKRPIKKPWEDEPDEENEDNQDESEEEINEQNGALPKEITQEGPVMSEEPTEAEKEIAEELERMDKELDRKEDELKVLEEMEELKLKLENLEQDKGGKYHTQLPFDEPRTMDRRTWMAKNRPELVKKAKELKELSDLVVELHGGKDKWFGGSDYWFGVYWGVNEQ